MMPSDRLVRRLPELLTELVEPQTPAYFADLLEMTAGTRQRPAWTIAERWLPVLVARQRVASPRFPWRSLILVTLIGLGLALGAALVIGALPRVPQPFGLARNGQIAFARDGDIFVSDPVSGVERRIVSGPELDLGPVFSLQGDQVAFLRSDPGHGERLMVADASGSNAIEVAGPHFRVSDVSWSPDASVLAFASSVHGFPTVTLAGADGSGARDLDLGMPAEAPSWRPPDGQQLLVRGSGGVRIGLAMVNADGSDLRWLDLSSAGGERDFYGAIWSPDGTRLAYQGWNERIDRLPGERQASSRIHVADVAGDGTVTSDRILEIGSTLDDESWAGWSPDGSRLVFQHGFDSGFGGQIEPMIAAADGSGAMPIGRARPNQPAVSGPLPPADSLPNNPNGLGFEWAPDGRSIIAIEYVDGAMWLLDPTGRPGISVDYGVGQIPSWQRLAR